MRRNVRRLNREVGSLNASQGSSKRKAPGTGSKGSKKSKDTAAGDDTMGVEYGELALQMMTGPSSSADFSGTSKSKYSGLSIRSLVRELCASLFKNS